MDATSPTPDGQSSAVELFSSGEFNLQVLPDDQGGFRVLAPGLARALAVTDSYTLLRSIPDDEKGSALVRTPGGEQRVSYVTEAGFYRAIGQRQTGRITDPTIRDTVERFQSWVYNDVLPRIRRTGAYAVPAQRPELSNRDLALMVIAEADRADAAEARAAELAPKAAAADALTDADGALSIGAVANMFGVGRTTLFRILYAEGVLMRDKRPYQRWADAFRVVATTHETSTGKEVVDYTAYIYPAGAVRLHQLLTRRGHTLRQLSGRPELAGGVA